MQIYILATPASFSKHNVSFFRLMLHYLHGPLAALLFPVTECLHLPFEVSIYWIQHVLLLVVPIYLLICDYDEDDYNDDNLTYTAHEVKHSDLKISGVGASPIIWENNRKQNSNCRFLENWQISRKKLQRN
jgi:hypothetical protein